MLFFRNQEGERAYLRTKQDIPQGDGSWETVDATLDHLAGAIDALPVKDRQTLNVALMRLEKRLTVGPWTADLELFDKLEQAETERDALRARITELEVTEELARGVAQARKRVIRYRGKRGTEQWSKERQRLCARTDALVVRLLAPDGFVPTEEPPETREVHLKHPEGEPNPFCDVDPADSHRLSVLRAIIDEKIGWRDAAQERAGDYEARLTEIAEALAVWRQLHTPLDGRGPTEPVLLTEALDVLRTAVFG